MSTKLRALCAVITILTVLSLAYITLIYIQLFSTFDPFPKDAHNDKQAGFYALTFVLLGAGWAGVASLWYDTKVERERRERQRINKHGGKTL